MDRRQFILTTAKAALGSMVLGGGYSVLEAKWCGVTRVSLGIPRLPAAFAGTKIAFLADIHHGPYVPLAYVNHVVKMTNALRPDLVALGGDYLHRSAEFAAPCIAELGKLRSRLGTYAVLGNHDHYHGARAETRKALHKADITELTNSGVWIGQEGARMRLCGVGDLLTEAINLNAALGDATRNDAVILLSHNPDYVEMIRDQRVGMVLSGHTHGGQVTIPFFGPPIVPSRYGKKYVYGLVQGPVASVFVTRGVGTISPPVRFLCRPEIVLITLAETA